MKKVYIIMQDCIDPFFGPELAENGVCYKSKEDAENVVKKHNEDLRWTNWYVAELEVK